MENLDLIELINIEYQRRCEKNKSYSLRAYGRDLKVLPATLSHLMKRKRAASPDIKKKIYKALKLSDEQIGYLDSKNETNPHQFNKRDMDIFISLSEWYFDAIMELVRNKDFESNAEFVSKRLGINIEEARSSIDRLFKMGLLKISQNKSWIDSNENSIVYGGDQTNFALQRLQRQLLEKAILALEKTPKKDREQASMVMAINKKDLPEAKIKIKEFQQELCKFLQRPNRDSDEVYQLITSFFPLTVSEKN